MNIVSRKCSFLRNTMNYNLCTFHIVAKWNVHFENLIFSSDRLHATSTAMLPSQNIIKWKSTWKLQTIVFRVLEETRPISQKHYFLNDTSSIKSFIPSLSLQNRGFRVKIKARGTYTFWWFLKPVNEPKISKIGLSYYRIIALSQHFFWNCDPRISGAHRTRACKIEDFGSKAKKGENAIFDDFWNLEMSRKYKKS